MALPVPQFQQLQASDPVLNRVQSALIPPLNAALLAIFAP